MKKFKANKQAGFTLIELVIVLVIMGVLGAAIAAFRGGADFQSLKKQTSDGISLIASDARAKKGAGNYNVITDISVLCNDGYLTETMCGTGNDGVGTNPFGGDWVVAPSTNFGAAHLSVGVTGIPDGRFAELADTLAGQSYKACQSSTDCASITVTEPQENGAGGEIYIDI
ncbi:type II secretion system protein [Vibrio gangliei]|uniref:type II secretion system protein n=1 Tax=Vibrio gangliei TaxID=2077090 RepID=UPI000D0129C2|nr:type II secretion system protein [Vibrio gangliei]